MEPSTNPSEAATVLPVADAPAARPARDECGAVVQAWREALAQDPDFDPLSDVRLERLGELGRGGMGVVHRVRDKRLEREAALKVILRDDSAPGRSVGASAVARFVREVKLTARLEHPSIPPVYAAGTTSRGEHYLLMKLIDGVPFAKRLAERGRSGPVDDAERRWIHEQLEVLVKVGEAVAYAHGRRIVHRDLKPENVMVGRFGEVLVMDWGLAKDLDAGDEQDAHLPRIEVSKAELEAASKAGVTRMGAALGTPGYMAPEQAAGESVDERADVFALGAILSTILTGKPPFDGEGHLALMYAAMEGKVVLPRARRPGLPRELDSIAARALAPRKERFESAADFVRELRAYLAGELVSAHRYSARERAARAARRHATLLVWTGAALLLLLGVGLALAFARGQQIRAEEAQTRKDAAERSASELAAERARSQVYTDGGRLKILNRQVESELGFGTRDVPALELWLSEARALLAREARHDRERALRELASPTTAERAELQALTELDAGLQGLGPSVARIESRLAFARAVRERTVTGDEARTAWKKAAESVAAAKAYAGLELVPVEGFLPLGVEPDSGLLELWHPASGERPVKDEDEHFRVSERSGFVFVLVPGGSFKMGSLRQNMSVPIHEVRLKPFLLSKYEMTQAQWLRTSGQNPSIYKRPQYPTTLRHPVETVTWDEAHDMARVLGLTLPSESQWEYAERAGTTTDWWTGDQPGSLEGAENIADKSYLKHGGIMPSESWSDGYQFTSPVGTFRANRFGLHDMSGNVREWCEDAFQEDYENAPLDGSPQTVERGSRIRERALRGGMFRGNSYYARAALRCGAGADMRDEDLGLRPAHSYP